VSIIRHKATGTKLVWKQIALVKGCEEKQKKELEAALRAESPCLVPILDSFVDENFLYVVTAYYERGTLDTIVKELKSSEGVIEEEV
jgi:hypothetical protein